jgi:pilus assembly protein Flp/PilA
MAKAHLLLGDLPIGSKALAKLFRDQKGVTAMEYGVIGAAIFLAIVAILGTMGTNLTAKFSAIANALK